MTRLIVSVRSAEEARAALSGGADLIDVKEPDNGPLGCAPGRTLLEIANAVAGAKPLSAALGELGEPVDEAALSALSHYAYAKLGLAGAARAGDWRERWWQAISQLPTGVAPVGVVYADASSQSPAAADVIQQASVMSCGALLVDTHRKDGSTLLDHWTRAQLGGFIEQAKHSKMLSVVAGALTREMAREVTALNPDFVAVRSTVCEGNRRGPLRGDLVAKLSASLHGVKAPVGTTN